MRIALVIVLVVGVAHADGFSSYAACERARRAALASDATPTCHADDYPPAPSAGRVAAQLAAGAGVFAGSVLVVGGLAYAGGRSTEHKNLDAAAGGVLGGAIGMFAMTTTVWAIGRTDEVDGSWGITFGGAWLGLLGGTGLAVVAVIGSDNLAAAAAVALGPPIGATIGFIASRRDTTAPGVGSLIRVDRGGIAIGTPVAIPARGGAVVSLASGSF